MYFSLQGKHATCFLFENNMMHNVCNECIKNLLPVSASVSLPGVAHRNCKSLQAGFRGPHYLGELHAGTRTPQTGRQLQYVSYGVSGLTVSGCIFRLTAKGQHPCLFSRLHTTASLPTWRYLSFKKTNNF